MIDRWRYRCRIAALSLALLLVGACGDSVQGRSSGEQSPSALALVPDVADAGSSGDGSGAISSQQDSNPDDGPGVEVGVPNGEKPELFDPSENGQSGLGQTGNLFPLTGLVAPNLESMSRPVMMVKVDNHPRARPQTGLDQADLVFDVRAEGVTRFAAVFQSQVADPVGPVRSSRTSDFDLLLGFERPLYASSGGNANVAAGFRRLPIVEVTNLTRREYFRNGGRPPPHNLFVNASDLYALAPDDIPQPQPWFSFGQPGRTLPEGATPVSQPVSISFRGSPVVTHTWDSQRRGWLRTQDGNPHVTSSDVQLAPENVAIVLTDYGASSADPRSPEVRSTGGGDLVVLTEGHAIAGTWERDDATEPLTLLDSAGDEIVLTRGRTWVLMPEQGQVTFAAGEKPPFWP